MKDEDEGLKVEVTPKMSFIYRDEQFFLLEEEKKKSGGKSEFIWRFGEFFLFSFFSPSFHCGDPGVNGEKITD